MPPGARGRLRLLAGLLAALLPLPSAAERAAAPERCPAAVFRGTILQLLRRDAARPAADWTALMRDLRRFGLRELTLQWTSFGAIDFYGGRAGGAEALPILPAVLRAAGGAGLKVHVGLHHDPDWWSAASCPAAELDAWFARRLADLDARLPALRAALAAAPPGTVAGWYIPDELDDGTWQAQDREAALARYLQATVGRLGRIAPGHPTMISAFANGAQEPAGYGAQIRRLAAGAGISRFLFQDGIGAGKRTPDQARAAAQAIARALRGGKTRFGIVVELFDMPPSPEAGQEAATAPASIDAILTRLAAAAGIGDLPPTSFSHAHHLTAFGGPGAAARGTEWARLLARCGDRGR